MNQSILFNDDVAFDQESELWRFTGMVAGQKVVIEITTDVSPEDISTHDKLDWELAVEEWLEECEDIPPTIHITL